MKYLLYLCILVLLPACNNQSEEKRRAAENMPEENVSEGITNDLPDMPVRMTSGTFRQMNQVRGKSIIVLFQPDCDHCQREATAMKENLEGFSTYQVYYISSASPQELQEFAVAYGLDTAPNFHFGTTDVVNIIDKFGSIPVPSVYIYSENGKLQKEFIGETPIEEILQALN